MSSQPKTRQGGVLPITAAATKKNAVSQKASQRTPAPKLRLIIRRLPPGLAETEFWDAVGSDWQVGNGNVDWFAFKAGKVSKDPSKPSKPARAYLKVKDQSLLESLSSKIRQTHFKDAKNTGTDPCLIAPPSLEFAPYGKTPGGRMRNDGRQGTIDQDPEFIDFLQSLTKPITKNTVNGSEPQDTKVEKVTMTPLVQYIKEKKANKAKEKEAATAAKISKKAQDAKDAKDAKSKVESKPTVVVKSSTSSAEQTHAAKAAPEPSKTSSKATNISQTKAAIAKPEPERKSKDATQTAAATPKRERERGNASAAARMISRDLGLTPKEPRAPRGAKNATSTTTSSVAASTVTSATSNLSSASTTASAAPPAESTKSTPAVAKQVAPAASNASKGQNKSQSATSTAVENVTPPTGPRKENTGQSQPAKQQQQQQQQQQQPKAQRQTKAAPAPTAGAKSAFLKHANSSQGITEETLRAGFAMFGEITRCEIERKKGLGYIDFTEAEALKKAMAASPVKIGSGQVTVLENRSPYRKSGQRRVSDAGNASQTQSTPTASAVSAKNTAAVTSPPVAPTARDGNPSQDNPTNDKSSIDDAHANSQPTKTTEDGALTPTPASTRGGKGSSNAARGGRGGQNANAARNNAPNRGGGDGGGGRGGSRGGSRGGKGRRDRGGGAQNTSGNQPAAAAAPTSTPTATQANQATQAT